MAQNFPAMVALDPGGSITFTNLDDLGALLVNNGAQSAALHQTAQGVIKATPGRFFGIIVAAPGSTSGNFAVNDCATTGAIAAGNLIGQVAYNATANVAGAVLLAVPGGVPFANGLVLTVPGGGSPICSVLFT